MAAGDLLQLLQGEGIRVGYMGGTALRAVTHLDVTRADIEHVADTLWRSLS